MLIVSRCHKVTLMHFYSKSQRRRGGSFKFKTDLVSAQKQKNIIR